MKTLFITFAMMIAASTNAFAGTGTKDCKAMAATAAMQLEMLNHSVADDAVNVVATHLTKSMDAGGTSLDTYQVRLVVDDQYDAVYETKLQRAHCLVKSVRFVTGD